MKLLDQITEHVGLGPITQVTPLVPGTEVFCFETLHQGTFVCKTYNLEFKDSLFWEHDLVKNIASKNMSFLVPVPLPQKNAGTWFESNSKLIVVYRFIEGDRLSYNSIEDIALLGKTTGELHLKLSDCSNLDRPGPALFKNPFELANADCDPLLISPSLLGLTSSASNLEVLSFWNDTAQKIKTFLFGTYNHLSKMICHNDLTCRNLLKKDKRIVAVLDFEFSCAANRLLDVAMGLLSTMHPSVSTEPWETLRLYATGYRSTNSIKLTQEEIRHLPDLMKLRSAMSIFLRLSRLKKIPDHSGTIDAIERLRSISRWLEQNSTQLVEEAERSFCI